MRKQKLSPEASKAKAVRDKKIAMTGHRKKRKRENERMGQRSDSDIHHTKDGKQVRVPIKDNRGNFGKGTKNEGPNMMGQTWLNRKINGPSAIGEGDKKKGGVKPYIAKDDADYAKRTQMYNDSLAAYNATQNIINTLKTPNMIVEDNAYTDHNYYTNVEGSTGDLNSAPYESYSGVKGVAQDIKTLKRTEKSLGNTESVKSKMYYDGGGRNSTFELPYRPKPIQTIKSPRPDMAKMPILKGSIKSKSAPEKLSNRKPTYNPPRKFTSSTNKMYGEVNYGDKTGNKVLNKAEFEAHKKLFKK